MQALAGLRVLELGQGLPAAYCGRQFALWGAEVAVVEPGGGSPLRDAAPRVGDISLLWEYVAAGKRSVEGVTAEALAGADVVIVDRAGGLGRLGLTAREAHAAYPGLIILDLSPFGADGPFAGLAAAEITVQAFSGYAHLNGEPGHAPLKSPAHIVTYACGVSAFVAGLGAIVGRLNGHGGAHVETSELEAIASILPLLRGQYTGLYPQRTGGPPTGIRLLPCLDGFVSFLAPSPKQIEAFSQALGVPAEAWPAVAHEARAPNRYAVLAEFMAPYTARMTVDEVFDAISGGINDACGWVSTPADLVADPHLAARGYFRELDHPKLGRIAMPGPAAHLSRTPAAKLGPAPEARAPLGWDGPSAFAAPAGPSTGKMPLAGLKILDLTQAWIGPYAAMLLADLGADVVKIESHLRPDVWRQWASAPVPLTTIDAEEVNASPNYNSVNCNKRSLCLNFKAQAGKDILLRLVKDADLLMENFTPRIMERFGLDYAALSAVNPRLVMSSYSGFGRTGPLSDHKANGTTIEAIAGWDHFHRYADGRPMVMGFYQADAITGLQMAATTLVALVHQARTGEGQAVDGSMMEAAAGYIGEAILDAQFGQEQTPSANRHPDAAPHGIYPAAGEDRWIAVAVMDDDQWRRLIGVAPELAEDRFATAAGRLAAADELDARLAAWTQAHEAQAAMDRLQAAGVAAAVVRSPQEMLDCLQLAEQGWFRALRHADVGEHRYNGLPWRFTGVKAGPHLPSPRLGEHGREILRDRLRLTDAEIEALFAADVTGAVLARTQVPEEVA